ncbi:hypothetical protein BDA99DRAFT_558894 [Phascolomyces articulosus]|uniref:Uncharacterized protein n=1 Tax=Phascolomyces articulosus TaxID=60185 RepID=A0AAD5K311_9FUNG|nr:hypothetical protein BDA99DRAFT_558894 [Phascolomyces articulosus]
MCFLSSLSSIVVAAIIILLIVAPHQQAQSYCVYNLMNDNTEIPITQISGQEGPSSSTRYYSGGLIPGGEGSCCPYTNKQCSEGPNKDHIVKFKVSAYHITCPAGGYIEFGGNYLEPTFHVFYANHTPFDYDLEEKAILV